jgi:hypothetical protein
VPELKKPLESTLPKGNNTTVKHPQQNKNKQPALPSLLLLLLLHLDHPPVIVAMVVEQQIKTKS